MCVWHPKKVYHLYFYFDHWFIFGRKIKCMLQKKIIVEECFNENNNTRAHEEENYFWKGTTLCVVIFFKKSLSLKCVFCRIRLLYKKTYSKLVTEKFLKRKKEMAWLFIFVSRVCTFVYLCCFVSYVKMLASIKALCCFSMCYTNNFNLRRSVFLVSIILTEIFKVIFEHSFV